jgi:hypothetical protein
MPRTVPTDAAERLQDLRRRLASSENKDTVRRIAADLEELSWTAPKPLRADIGDFTDRLNDKLGRISPEPKRRAPVAVTNHARAMSTMIEMRIGPWETDENGNRSRSIWNSADGPSPPP